MTEPSNFYHNQLDGYTRKASELKKSLNLSSALRLIAFLAICGGVYFSFGHYKTMGLIIICGIALFLYLVTRHSKLQYQRDFVKALITINERELKVGNREFLDLPDGSVFKDPTHTFSQDIDLFGRGSFYQYLNRTALESGSQKLAHILTENAIRGIPEKQEAIKELGNLPVWRQEFSAMASLVQTEVKASTVVAWLKEYRPFSPKGIKNITRIFSLLSIGFSVLYYFGLIPGYWIFVIFLVGLLVTGRYAKKINTLATHTGKIQSTFEQYYKLLASIENREMSSDLLSRKRASIINTTYKASLVVQQFSKRLDALDQRNNILVGFITNGFFLRDLSIVSDIERWIATYSDDIENWFEVIAFFDAYNSLGNFAFNHPLYQYPEITEDTVQLQSEKAAHPLLNPEKAVYNDFRIEKEQFFIVTGANMAGKSTFLRTVALQVVMSNVGLPLCSSKTVYSPIKLITSMRTTDSLTDDESYFFSELKRLKFIVEALASDRYFIILDEILKGTNSTDKAIGSRKFVEKLVNSKSTGIIATHDLSLTETANELPQVENYFFDARIENDELFFDYTFKKGVCENMNASFLLKKMNIVD